MNKSFDSISIKKDKSAPSSNPIPPPETHKPKVASKQRLSDPSPSSHPETVEPYQINLLKIKNPKKPLGKKLLVIFLIVSLCLIGFWGIERASSLTERIFTGQTTTFFGKVWEALRGVTGNIKLMGENSGQINILLLGVGGADHEGPYLTDTMLLAQIKPKTSEVTFISIPRDWLTSLPNNLGDRKINSVFAEGLARTKNWNTAGLWSRQAVERMSGQTIPYFAVIDFAGFEKAIDELGGLDIQIDNTFTDNEFPNEKLGYLPAQTFNKGTEHMNGQRALVFVRSRHGNNNEGSDFARGLRQQKVIKTFKDKILSKKLISSPGKINNLLEIVANHFHTNISPGEIFRLHDLVSSQNIQTFLSLNLGLETGLVCPFHNETNGYVLIPCADKDENDIRAFFKNAFLYGKLKQEQPRIWLANSTRDPKIYTQAEKTLLENGFTVWQLNYDKDELTKHIVYSVNPKPASLEFIQNNFSTQTVSLPPPGVKINQDKVDLILILGQK